MRIDWHVPAGGWAAADDPALVLRALDAGADSALLKRWFDLPYAVYWGMQGQSEEQVRGFYAALNGSGHALAAIGRLHGARVFLVECYDPAAEGLADHYAMQPGDVGMHFFVGPADTPMRGFTRRVFRSILHFLFDHLQARRVIVEPDVRNHKVRLLNREMGFVEQREIALPHKRACLSFCSRADFVSLTASKELTA